LWLRFLDCKVWILQSDRKSHGVKKAENGPLNAPPTFDSWLQRPGLAFPQGLKHRISSRFWHDSSRALKQSRALKHALQLLRALHGANAGYAAEGEDHAVQVMHVLGFRHKLDDGLFALFVMDLNAADVGVVFGDDGGQLL